jgi:hypothetical protein
MEMTNLIKLPKRFFYDHKDRDLDTPTIVKENKRNVWVSASDPHLCELKQDAVYYCDMGDMGAFDSWMFGIVRSAKATAKALEHVRH